MFRLKGNTDIILLLVITAALVVLALFAKIFILQIIFALPLVLFSPGYALIAVIFNRKDSISSIERVTLSFVLSIAIVPLAGLLLNYTVWGINLYSVTIVVASIVVIFSSIATIRRLRIPEEERFAVHFSVGNFFNKLNDTFFSSPEFDQTFSKSRQVLSRSLTLILIIAILTVSVFTVIAFASNKSGEHFTEFYILGSNGQVADYPVEVKQGNDAVVTVGIINHERLNTSYDLQVNINGLTMTEQKDIVLANEEKWEQPISFKPVNVGDHQKVDFLLFKAGQTLPYLTLQLWINVTS